jgi:DNA-directed RNA polymerase subunit RPC12/RpoP
VGAENTVSDNSNHTLEFFCPKCNQKLRAANRLAGQRLVCPKCQQTVKIPGIAPTSSSDDEWLDLDSPPANSPNPQLAKPQSAPPRSAQPQPASLPPTPVAVTSPSEANYPPPLPASSASSTPDSEDFSIPSSPIDGFDTATNADPFASSSHPAGDDDDLPALAPLAPPSGGTNFASDLFASIRLDEMEAQPPTKSSTSIPKAAGGRGMEVRTENHDAEYRVTCRTCGTPQYVPLRKKGKSIRCPDCHSDFVVPPPPANWNPESAKAKAGSGKQVDHEIRMETESEAVLPAPEPQRLSANEYLKKAEEESLDEHIDQVYANGNFDTQEFMRKNFRMFSDLSLWLHAGAIGVLTGIAMATIVAMAQREPTPIPGIVLNLIGLFSETLVIGLTFLCSYALVDAGAHQRFKMTHWPLSSIPTLLSDGKPVLLACVAAIIPGAVLALLMLTLSVNVIAIMIPLFLSFWGLFPIILLSMLNSGSISIPFSGKVFESFTNGREEWGAYYFKTAVAFFLAFLTLSVGFTNVAFALIAGITMPLSLFFAFYQTGTLGSEISRWLDVDIGNPIEPAATPDELPR